MNPLSKFILARWFDRLAVPVAHLVLVGALGVLLLGPAVGSGTAKSLAELRVLFVGDAGSERTREFQEFLKPSLGEIAVTNREGFQPQAAAGYDVVLLDWHQGDDLKTLKSHPLGERAQWRKPTVLLGSAGLLTAVTWQVRGGSGCTCLFPFVYAIKDHELFHGPVPVPLKPWRRSTPGVWTGEIKESEIEVVPLVEDYSRRWSPGWCSYSGAFAQQPEVEFFCSGINDKTPTAGALWRQGNLFHFGFEQSPAEMNATGQALLLNAIAYISRFSQDRPIAVTPSVFVAPDPARRDQVLARLQGKNGGVTGLSWMLTAPLYAEVEKLAPEDRMKWWDRIGRFLHADAAGRLAVDADLVALGEPFDTPEFFEKTIAGLGGAESVAQRSRRLLARYVPEGPQQGSAATWQQWWTKNRPYLFAFEVGGGRWYLDPLAQARGIPTAELRGPKRADLPAAP